jgi:hypothetical protein
MLLALWVLVFSRRDVTNTRPVLYEPVWICVCGDVWDFLWDVRCVISKMELTDEFRGLTIRVLSR